MTPQPLIPAECDLRDFQYMELDVRVLRDSRFAAQVSGDAFRAGVLLWCAAWHQVPAGSLPDDDIELANLAGYGRFTKEWRKVRDEALTKFVKCSDGRLYHSEVCEKALAAWNAKLRHHYDKARERLRKANKARTAEGLQPLPEITFDVWNERRLSGGIPPEKADASTGIPPIIPPPETGIPPENALKGRGNGEGTERRGNGEGDSPIPPLRSGTDALRLSSAGVADAPPAASAKPAREPKAKAEPPPTAATWEAYAEAYAMRHGASPVRNAKVNALLAQVVARLGASESPSVAAFFVGHNNALYVRAMHPVDLLVRDAEKLRTEWATNRQVTATQAAMVDRTQTNANAFAPLIAEARAKETAHGIV